jgi:alpha-amylase
MSAALEVRGIKLYADLVLNHMANEAGQRADLNFPGTRVRSVYASDPTRWQRQRLFGHAIAALKTSRTAQPGQRIDDQANMKTPHNTLL